MATKEYFIRDGPILTEGEVLYRTKIVRSCFCCRRRTLTYTKRFACFAESVFLMTRRVFTESVFVESAAVAEDRVTLSQSGNVLSYVVFYPLKFVQLYLLLIL